MGVLSCVESIGNGGDEIATKPAFEKTNGNNSISL